jgi:lysyl-tRNA synthetase class 2
MKTWQRLKQHPDRLKPFWVREQVIDAIRSHFKAQKFHEIETPKLIPQPSTEPFLEVFETQLKYADGNAYTAFLPSSPEFSIKKLLAAGIGSCFEICKSFRNGEGKSGRHNPEFTILEWYRTPGDYTDVMKDCEEMFASIYKTVFPQNKDVSLPLPYQGKTYALAGPWERISVEQAFERYAQITTDELLSEELLLKRAKEKGYSVDSSTTWEQIYNQILFNEIEPKLGTKTPTFLYDYPASQAALSLKKVSDPRFAERFEVFLAGFELGNAFSELTDWKEQEARCLADLAERKKLGKTEYGMDTDFIEALKMGMPRTGGIAMGVDRIAALFADVPEIQDVLFFPASELFS